MDGEHQSAGVRGRGPGAAPARSARRAGPGGPGGDAERRGRRAARDLDGGDVLATLPGPEGIRPRVERAARQRPRGLRALRAVGRRLAARERSGDPARAARAAGRGVAPVGRVGRRGRGHGAGAGASGGRWAQQAQPPERRGSCDGLAKQLLVGAVLAGLAGAGDLRGADRGGGAAPDEERGRTSVPSRRSQLERAGSASTAAAPKARPPLRLPRRPSRARPPPCPPSRRRRSHPLA